MAKADLTAARLRELLHYDPETGVFTWKAYRHGMRPDMVAGATSEGRRFITVDGSRMRAHRAAWLYVHGCFPVADIDHINGDPLDNRLANLRDVGKCTNQQNQRAPQKHNTSGYLGVSWRKRTQKWRATIRFSGRNWELGSFPTAEEAAAAYLEAKRKHHAGCTI